MKHLSILGSTGSIGTQTLDIVKENPSEFKVLGLTTNQNIELLKKQIEQYQPEAVAVMDEQKADELQTDIPVYKGLQGITQIAKLQGAETVVNALVGSIGVKPTLAAIRDFKNIALANKETLVTAGKIVMEQAKQHGVTIMPIDSEHSAIFQCLNGENLETVKKITLTCSGGPFKHKTQEELRQMQASDALKHPTWNMGAKITIDSATLMNKGFEVLETHHLYQIPYENIEVVIHPQSIIHSMVEFCDNSVMAQLGNPDMRIPIQYALSFPKRLPNATKQLDIINQKELTFDTPNLNLFPCLSYAYEAGKKGGTLPAVLNAANEIAVRAFLDKKIGFLDIPRIIKEEMDQHKSNENADIDEIMDVDHAIKQKLTKQLE